MRGQTENRIFDWRRRLGIRSLLTRANCRLGYVGGWTWAGCWRRSGRRGEILGRSERWGWIVESKGCKLQAHQLVDHGGQTTTSGRKMAAYRACIECWVNVQELSWANNIWTARICKMWSDIKGGRPRDRAVARSVGLKSAEEARSPGASKFPTSPMYVAISNPKCLHKVMFSHIIDHPFLYLFRIDCLKVVASSSFVCQRKSSAVFY